MNEILLYIRHRNHCATVSYLLRNAAVVGMKMRY